MRWPHRDTFMFWGMKYFAVPKSAKFIRSRYCYLRESYPVVKGVRLIAGTELWQL